MNNKLSEKELLRYLTTFYMSDGIKIPLGKMAEDFDFKYKSRVNKFLIEKEVLINLKTTLKPEFIWANPEKKPTLKTAKYIIDLCREQSKVYYDEYLKKRKEKEEKTYTDQVNLIKENLRKERDKHIDSKLKEIAEYKEKKEANSSLKQENSTVHPKTNKRGRPRKHPLPKEPKTRKFSILWGLFKMEY